MNPVCASRSATVIGGGVIGLFTAWRLSIAGYKVALIERDAVAVAATGTASWAAGGMLTPLPPDHVPEAIRPLLEESLAVYADWCAQLQAESGVDPEYWVCGAEYLKSDGQRLRYPQMAQVRSPRLLQALAGALRQRGVALIEHTEVLGYVEASGRLQGVRTNRGDKTCDVAVLATGAWSSPLGATGIRPAKGQMLLARAAPGTLPRMLIGDDAYLIPRRDGHILIGSTLEDTGFDHTTTADARAVLLKHAAALWPAITTLPIVHQWAGLRPSPQSDAPLVSAHPQRSGLWLATGHFRLGITLAPATAAQIVRQIESQMT